ncbi:MAG: glycosyltransferase family 9 protein, partial [Pirellulaceae bacterium]
DRWLPALESVEEHFDYHCSLIDLASVFVEIASDIQAGGPYITPNPGLVEYWRHWAEQRFTSGKRRVGIVWQGNPRQPVDHFRSCPLAALEPLTRVESVQLLSLQIGMGNDQLTDWAQRNKILVVPPEFDNASGAFMDSAALLAHLDLLISVDTAILHVAGALGRPVWLLLGSAPDWRWMIQRSDSPWYSTLRLFRQTRPGAWDTVVGRVVAALDGGPSGCEKSYSFAG